MREVVSFVESDVRHENISIRCETCDGLSSVEVDPIEIQQVVVNLVRNASDAMTESDCLQREIVIETRKNNSRGVEVVVSDSGPGLSQEMIDRVFEPFYTSKHNGLGIGLGICKSIVETHGGRIWIGRSSMGGASIHFDLPAKLQPDEANAN